MGRSSSILKRELENLDKDADSRKSAMKALKSYVKELDPKTIPLFLAQVAQISETKENDSSEEYTISLYEVLARVHGTKIIPQIDNIMATIIKTLSSNTGSFSLHQACSKVVPSIARYGIEPTMAEDKKKWIIKSLCKPLSECLLGSQENLSSGSALCLEALVDCDNWRYASNEIINEVCERVVGALGKHTQICSHMKLVMALVKHNSLIVEAYSRLLVHTGLQILNNGDSQTRLTSIHMLNILMKCLDSKSVYSEVGFIIDEMEKFQRDEMAYVSKAAYEALQMAKRIEKDPKFERDESSVSGSSFDPRRNLWPGDESSSPLIASPDSQIIDLFLQNESPISNQRSVNDGFTGFFHCSVRNDGLRSNTPSPQRSCSHINVDNVKFFSTPRKLIHSLDELNSVNSSAIRYKSPLTRKVKFSPTIQDKQKNGTFQSSSESESKSISIQKGRKELIFGFFIMLFLAFSVFYLWIDNEKKGCNLVPT